MVRRRSGRKDVMPDSSLEKVYEVLDRTERPYSAVYNISVILSASTLAI